jgi:protein-S-isoprenylcysteine O-methyltransferase Ste14
VNGKTRTADRLMMALAVVTGVASIGLFAWDARPTLVPLMWPPRAALAWDAGLWSGWMLVGTLLEERDLVADFGDAYRRYQRQVPMLVPWRRPAAR